MYFHSPSYLFSGRPHSAELRRLMKTALIESTKARVRRVLKGRIARNSEDNREKYNALAGYYYSHFETEQPRVCWYRGRLTMATASDVRNHTIELLSDAIRKAEGTSILEVGCGDGNNVAMLKEAFPEARVAGCDISDGRIEFAKKYHGERGVDVELIVGNATQLPYADKSFDVVYSLYCLEHLPVEFPQAVREMLRVAKKKVILIEPVAEYFGPLQKLFVWWNDYIRGLPQFLEREGIVPESVELLSSAANWMNLGAMVTLDPNRARVRGS